MYYYFFRFSKDDEAKDKRVASLEREIAEANKRIEEILNSANQCSNRSSDETVNNKPVSVKVDTQGGESKTCIILWWHSVWNERYVDGRPIKGIYEGRDKYLKQPRFYKNCMPKKMKFRTKLRTSATEGSFSNSWSHPHSLLDNIDTEILRQPEEVAQLMNERSFANH